MHQLNELGDETFFPEALRDDEVLGLNEGQLRIILRRLLTESCIESDGTVLREEDRLKIPHRLTWKGIQEAEQVDQPREASIPASDRYVSISDNQQAEFAAELGNLRDAVRGSNGASEEERERALYEIAVFETSIVAPLAATDLIQRFVDHVMKWITVAFTGALVAEVAQRLVRALLPLLS
jgi:hypothetical protein